MELRPITVREPAAKPQRSISNGKILGIGTLFSGMAFMSGRFNDVVFYSLAGGCVAFSLLMVTGGLDTVTRRFSLRKKYMTRRDAANFKTAVRPVETRPKPVPASL